VVSGDRSTRTLISFRPTPDGKKTVWTQVYDRQ
jgi:hypothetical protein